MIIRVLYILCLDIVHWLKHNDRCIVVRIVVHPWLCLRIAAFRNRTPLCIYSASKDYIKLFSLQLPVLTVNQANVGYFSYFNTDKPLSNP